METEVWDSEGSKWVLVGTRWCYANDDLDYYYASIQALNFNLGPLFATPPLNVTP